MMRSVITVLAVAVLPALGAAAAEPEVPPARPNILLITLDTTRADVLGCYGGDPKVSPNLDRIAGRSHLFHRCETPVPQTVPAHTSLFSGLQPFNHGVRKNLEIRIGPEVPLIAEELRGKGYRTGAFVSAFVVDRRFGFGRGFDHFDAPDTRPAAGSGMERRAGETVRAADAWIATQISPWFVWVHLFDPHAPYEPPPPFAGRFTDHPYAGEVAYMDNEIGRLVGGLVARGEFDSAVIVIAGDHGEALGEHGEPTHGILLYEATTRVPLLIHMPGQTEMVRHPETVGLIDVAPTLREMLGIERASDGVSLLPVLRGKGRLTADRSLYLESLEGYLRSGWAPIFAVVRDGVKYIHSPRPELYDLDDDPDELEDLVGRRPQEAAALDLRLAEIRPANEDFEGETVSLSADEQSALIALGYVTGSPGRAAGTRRNPADAIHLSVIHQRALEAQAAGDLDEAASLFQKELDEDPSSPVLLWYLGTSISKKDPARAQRLFGRAIELRPAFDAPYVALSNLLLRQGKTAEAMVVVGNGLVATSDFDGQLHFIRAAAAVQKGASVDRALGDLEIAIERAARPGPAYRLRAAVRLQLLDDVPGALADLESFVDWSTDEEIRAGLADPGFKGLRGNPDFERLKTRVTDPTD